MSYSAQQPADAGMVPNQSTAEDEEETVEGLLNKLAIERRVQYGAEKMLDVIEQRGGGGSDEQEQIKDRIVAQLESANDQIKYLELRLERLRGSEGTPLKNRRRPQPRLNGYASTSSLGAPLSSSMSSSLLSASSRPRLRRQGSSFTADQDHRRRDSPSRPGTHSPSIFGSPRMGRAYSHGAESDATGHSGPMAGEGGGRIPWGRSSSGLSSPSLGDWVAGDENLAAVAETIQLALRRLRDITRRNIAAAKGKGKEVERGDEAWECLIKVGDVIKKSPALKEVLVMDQIVASIMPFLVDSATSRQRAAAYRALRYGLTRASWGRMLANGLEWLVIRTFSRDTKAVLEKEQALRLIRAVIVLPRDISSRRSSLPHSRASPSRRSPQARPRGPPALSSPVLTLLDKPIPLTDGMIRAVVSCAENPDDSTRSICLVTLVEIAILDVERLLLSDAFRTILLTLKDGPAQLCPGITGMLILLSNVPATRHLLVPGADVELVLAGLTEEYGKVSARHQPKFVEKLQASATNIGMLMNSWPGLLYLCMDDCGAVKSLIQSLYVPVEEMRDALLDLIISVLRIRTPAFMAAFLEGKRLTVYNRTQAAASQTLNDTVEEESLPPPLTLVDHFVAFVLAVLLQCGLVEALIALMEANDSLSRKAILILGEVLRLSNRILPMQYAARLQTLPRLFNGATAFNNAADRNFALSSLSSINSLNRNQGRESRHIQTRERSSSTLSSSDPIQRGQRSVHSLKVKAGMAIEDRQFQQMIVDSGVLLGRDHTKWNTDIIMELIEGPFMNPKRLDEAIRATKFIRRLFSFFHPYSNRFSSIKRTRPSYKWVKMACGVLETMLASSEGVKFLAEDKLMRELAHAFNEIDNTPHRQHSIFGAERVENSLTYGYFEMIGTLSRHPEGLRLIEKFHLWNSFYHILGKNTRYDLVELMLECFDYNIDSHARVLLSKALISGDQEIRLFATHQLGGILHQQVPIQDWSLELMIAQLYDLAIEVCDVAAMYLEEVSGDAAALEKVVSNEPDLEHLGEIGYALFMRFVSTSTGFKYLHQAGHIDRELESWMTERNLMYVIEVETFVTRTVRPFTSDSVEDVWNYRGIAPTHFLGELAKTREGCAYLREKGLVPDLAEIVRLHGMEAANQSIMTNVKSVLWALGHIGSSTGGLPFLEDEEIIESIVEIAEQSPVLTMKGTCFFVLGLISTSVMGAEMLEEFGWVATRDYMGRPTGICLPSDIGRFAFIEPWERLDVVPPANPLPKLAGLEAEIMTYIANLSNYVLAAKAMNNLKRIRSKHPRHFASITLFHRALRIISTNHYQAPVRRFILGLFEIDLEPDVLIKLRHIEASLQEQAARRSTRDEESWVMSPIDTAHPRFDQRSEANERRRRSASSPGPEPPGRMMRMRGMTVSEVQ